MQSEKQASDWCSYFRDTILVTDDDRGIEFPSSPAMGDGPLSPETPQKRKSELPLGVEIALDVATAPLPGFPFVSTSMRLVKTFSK